MQIYALVFGMGISLTRFTRIKSRGRAATDPEIRRSVIHIFWSIIFMEGRERKACREYTFRVEQLRAADQFRVHFMLVCLALVHWSVHHSVEFAHVKVAKYRPVNCSCFSSLEVLCRKVSQPHFSWASRFLPKIFFSHIYFLLSMFNSALGRYCLSLSQ